MALPWKFSPYLPSHVRHEDIDNDQVERAPFSVARPLSPPSVIANLNPNCFSHMRMASRLCRSSSTTKMRRIATSLAASDTACGRSPAKKGRFSLDRGAAFRLANQYTMAFPLQITGLSALHRV